MLKNEINVPFSGYYETNYSMLLDDITNLDEYAIAVNHGWEDTIQGDNEQDFIEKNNIDIETEQEKHYDLLDFPKMKEAINKIYIEEYAEAFNNETALGLKLNYSLMESPKYYNYSTDRLFATISEQDKEKLYKHAEKHIVVFRRVLQEHCTSYDGFSSSYSMTLLEWLGKNITEYDHNELNILLYVALDVDGVNIGDFENSIFEAVYERCVCNGSVEYSYKSE